VERVTGIGGIFFKARDPQALQAWYERHLGIDVQSWGGAALPAAETTIWSIGPADGGAPFTINYRVADLHALLAALREEGCEVLDEVGDSEYGTFGWVIDPEGNRVELWQPPAGQ
jgi:predicted enzyme related to lactoylglutathione lyase